jgi:hypothetical protein
MKPLPFLASALTGILLTATLTGPALAATPETPTNTSGASATTEDSARGGGAVNDDTAGTPAETTVDAQTDEVTTLPLDSSDVTIVGATWEGGRPRLGDPHP